MNPVFSTCRARALIGSLVLCLSGAVAAQELTEPVLLEAQVHTVQDLVKFVQQHERSITKIEMAIDSTGRFPDGSEFRTAGTLRVLGTTHFHARMQASYGEGMNLETETVRTPNGIQMWERDPSQGDVFLRMDKALMERVDSATQALGRDAESNGFAAREARSPLSSLMLEDLARQFELTLREPVVVGEQRCWVVGGPLKTDATPDPNPVEIGADQVDVLVRVSDGAVVRMTQLKDGKPLLEVRIPKLELDGAFEADSFVLDAPAKAVFIDVLDHPPARMQIDRLFADAKERGWTDPAEAATGEPAKRTDPGR